MTTVTTVTTFRNVFVVVGGGTFQLAWCRHCFVAVGLGLRRFCWQFSVPHFSNFLYQVPLGTVLGYGTTKARINANKIILVRNSFLRASLLISQNRKYQLHATQKIYCNTTHSVSLRSHRKSGKTLGKPGKQNGFSFLRKNKPTHQTCPRLLKSPTVQEPPNNPTNHP